MAGVGAGNTPAILKKQISNTMGDVNNDSNKTTEHRDDHSYLTSSSVASWDDLVFRHAKIK